MIEKYEVNGDILQISTSNGMLGSTVFHPCTSIVLVDDLIVVQRCHTTEKIEVFGSDGWETCPSPTRGPLVGGALLGWPISFIHSQQDLFSTSHVLVSTTELHMLPQTKGPLKRFSI